MVELIPIANITGPKGPQGSDGPRGQVGATGPASTVPGPKGDQGSKGSTGAKGDKGDQGPQGIQGIKGDHGTNGSDGTSVAIQGTVANAAALPASASNGEGWITNDDRHLHIWSGGSFLDVGLVKGPKGDQGPVGPKGDQGPKGNTGAVSTTPGPKGDTGADSTVPGPRGQQGPKGDKGDSGDPSDITESHLRDVVTGTVINLGNISGTVSLSSTLTETNSINAVVTAKATGTVVFQSSGMPSVLPGTQFVLRLTQDSIGSRILILTGIMKSEGLLDVSSDPGAIDLIIFFYDGTNWFATVSGVGFAV